MALTVLAIPFKEDVLVHFKNLHEHKSFHRTYEDLRCIHDLSSCQPAREVVCMWYQYVTWSSVGYVRFSSQSAS
jgi:hypothetical protein